MQSNILWEKFLRLIELRGIEGSLKYINQGLIPDIEFDNPVVENVIRTICGKFTLSIEELIYGNGRKNDRKLAIGFCTYYLINCCKLSLGDIMDILKKEESICRKSMKNVERLNAKHSSDKPYLHYKNELDVIFLKEKSKL